MCLLDRYLKSIADDLITTCDEIIARVAKLYGKPTKTAPVNFIETCKIENLYILLFY